MFEAAAAADETFKPEEFMPGGDPKSKDSWFSKKDGKGSTKETSQINIKGEDTFDSRQNQLSQDEFITETFVPRDTTTAYGEYTEELKVNTIT